MRSVDISIKNLRRIMLQILRDEFLNKKSYLSTSLYLKQRRTYDLRREIKNYNTK